MHRTKISLLFPTPTVIMVFYIYIYALMLAGTLGSELLKCSMVDEMALRLTRSAHPLGGLKTQGREASPGPGTQIQIGKSMTWQLPDTPPGVQSSQARRENAQMLRSIGGQQGLLCVSSPCASERVCCRRRQESAARTGPPRHQKSSRPKISI